MTRRPLDAYYTPESATAELVKFVDWFDTSYLTLIFEPCVGKGAISTALQKYTSDGIPIVTNDIDKSVQAEAHMDAAKPQIWRFLTESHYGPPEYTISNPPFLYAPEIVWHALQYTTLGVAMLLRLSFLEGCEDRKWLAKTPPTDLVVLPRISFTEDGKSDMITCAWFIWDKLDSSPNRIKIVSKFK